MQIKRKIAGAYILGTYINTKGYLKKGTQLKSWR